jgi:hypothetical protein
MNVAEFFRSSPQHIDARRIHLGRQSYNTPQSFSRILLCAKEVRLAFLIRSGPKQQHEPG